ncbi:hypothetical protein JW859_11045 [bacterium]|nr:hypothetical protein [bacterium]
MAVLDISSWYVTWCEPVVVALYQRNTPEIRASLQHAYDALARGDLPPEEADCLNFQLTYLDFQAQLVLRDQGWDHTRLIGYIARLSEPSEFPSAERLRRRLYLQLRVNLDRMDMVELNALDFEEIFLNLPEEEYTTEAWLYISGWAFRKKQAEYLAKAYEFALLQAQGFEVEWTWQRVHLMWKLTRGDAKRDDIEWLIDRAEIEQHLMSIRKSIWKRAQQLGLIDESLELKLKERELEFREHALHRLNQHLAPHLVNRQAQAN